MLGRALSGLTSDRNVSVNDNTEPMLYENTAYASPVSKHVQSSF